MYSVNVVLCFNKEKNTARDFPPSHRIPTASLLICESTIT